MQAGVGCCGGEALRDGSRIDYREMVSSDADVIYSLNAVCTVSAIMYNYCPPGTVARGFACQIMWPEGQGHVYQSQEGWRVWAIQERSVSQ